MSNSELRPYQQAVIDQIRALGDARIIYDFPTGRGAVFNPGADRLTHERAERLILDLKMANDHRALNAAKTVDFTDAERRVMQSAMFGVRYGKTWTGSALHATSWREFLNKEMPEVPPRKTLMYYHVQNALMNWSE